MTTVSANISAFLGQCGWDHLPPQENQWLEEVNTSRLNRRLHAGYKNASFTVYVLEARRDVRESV
jgi:hypothetical protein